MGVENDEALFAHPLYEPRGGLPLLEIGHLRLPLMLMSYLGTFKSLVYRQVFRIVRPNLYSVRVPVLLAGVATVWLFALLLRRISGNRAAVIGATLLAADSIFLLTTCFDWGPVAFQHLLLVGGVLLVLKFYQDSSLRALCGGFFLFGLGMWDKALMVWMLSGLGVAAVLVFPLQIWRAISWKRLSLAILAFCLGAAPLIVFNLQHRGETFSGNTQFDFSDLHGKAHLLAVTLSGEGLFGWMVAEDVEVPVPHRPASQFDRAAFELSDLTGHRREGYFIVALVAAVLLLPLARGWELRACLFVLVALALAWVQMAITRNAGGSVHHTVLLWPWPHLLVAVSFTAAARRLGRFARPVLALALVAITLPSLLVMDQYYVQVVRNGGTIYWNDAILPLAVYLRDVPVTNAYCTDWGILDNIRLLNRGRTPVRVGNDLAGNLPLDEAGRVSLSTILKAPGNIFLAHTPGHEFFEGSNSKLVKAAATLGYQPVSLKIVSDSFGRPIFDVYRFQPVPLDEPGPAQ